MIVASAVRFPVNSGWKFIYYFTSIWDSKLSQAESVYFFTAGCRQLYLHLRHNSVKMKTDWSIFYDILSLLFLKNHDIRHDSPVTCTHVYGELLSDLSVGISSFKGLMFEHLVSHLKEMSTWNENT